MHDSTTPATDSASRPPNSRRWTTDELAILRRLAWTMSATQIGVLLGRTALAVRTKAAHERIRLNPKATDGDGPLVAQSLDESGT